MTYFEAQRQYQAVLEAARSGQDVEAELLAAKVQRDAAWLEYLLG